MQYSVLLLCILATCPLCYSQVLLSQHAESVVSGIAVIPQTERNNGRSKRSVSVKSPYRVVKLNELKWDLAGFIPNIPMTNVTLEWYIRNGDNFQRVEYAYRGNKYVMGYPLYGRTEHDIWFKVEHPPLQFSFYFSSYPIYHGEDDLQLPSAEANIDYSRRNYSAEYIKRFKNYYIGWAGNVINIRPDYDSDFEEPKKRVPYIVVNGSDLCVHTIGEKLNVSQMWYLKESTNRLKLIKYAYRENKYTEKGPVYGCTENLQWYRFENAPHSFKVYLSNLEVHHGVDDLLLPMKDPGHQH